MGWLSILSGSLLLAGVGAVLPLYAASEGFDELLIGLIFTVQAAASISVRLPFGHLIDRISRAAPILLVSITAASLATALLTAYSRYIWLTAMMGVLGVGISITVMGASVVIARHTDVGSRGSAMGFASMLRFTGFTVGPLLTATLTSTQSDIYTGYLLGFTGLGATALLTTLLGTYLGWRSEKDISR